MSYRFDTILFDLDGTLLDTHQDMGNALNTILKNHGKPSLPLQAIRPFVSKGGMVMVCLAFRCKPGSDESKALWHELLDAYAQEISAHTELFPGMDGILETIENSNRQWGIVTNKPGFLTDPLLKALEMDKRPGSVVSGDTLSEKKPHPAPLLFACNQTNSSPNRAIYIGDDERDVEAGKRAGMATLAAAYGYIAVEDDPASWNADGIVHHPQDIAAWLD
jgi:phosphoglycolate phosphatase